MRCYYEHKDVANVFLEDVTKFTALESLTILDSHTLEENFDIPPLLTTLHLLRNGTDNEGFLRFKMGLKYTKNWIESMDRKQQLKHLYFPLPLSDRGSEDTEELRKEQEEFQKFANSRKFQLHWVEDEISDMLSMDVLDLLR